MTSASESSSSAISCMSLPLWHDRRKVVSRYAAGLSLVGTSLRFLNIDNYTTESDTSKPGFRILG